MSFQAMTWACEQDLRTAEKMVLLMLANRCNHDTGRCDPSHRNLAKDCGMSKSTLKRSIDRLEALGLLTVEGRSQDGVSLPNQYHLHLGVSSQRPHPVRKKRTVGSERADGSVQSEGEGWVHSELQTSNLNQEVKPVSKPLSVAENSAPAPGGSGVPAVLSEGQQVEQEETAFQAKCKACWIAYGTAYTERYATAPIRNAKVNAQVKQLVQRLGEEAAAVADFFVRSINEAYVVRNCHELGALVAKAEAYRTQWATGRAMTAGQARQIDSTQTNANAADQAKAMLRARREKGQGQ